MSQRADAFVRAWVSKNVNNEPLIDDEGYDAHIGELRTALVDDAAREGLTLQDIEGAVGDLKDYIEEQFQNVYDPTVGGIKD
jgi:hypothetical protein